MFRSFELFKVFGISVKAHFTLLAFLPILAVMMPASFGFSLALVLLVFASVLLHELGHAGVAMSYGIRVPEIVLTPIGGVAKLGSMPSAPKKELLITIAGPLVNVALAAVFLPLAVPFAPGATADLLLNLGLVNVGLAVFNLLPAFPMDGGRILRALLQMTSSMSYKRATQISVKVASVTAFVMVVAAFSVNIMLIPMAIFVYLAAKTELFRVMHQEILQSMTQQMQRGHGAQGFGPQGFDGQDPGPQNPQGPQPTDSPAPGARDFVQRDGAVEPDNAPQRHDPSASSGQPDVFSREISKGPIRGSIHIRRWRS